MALIIEIYLIYYIDCTSSRAIYFRLFSFSIFIDGVQVKVFVELWWKEWMSSAIMDVKNCSNNSNLKLHLDIAPVQKIRQNVMD